MILGVGVGKRKTMIHWHLLCFQRLTKVNLFVDLTFYGPFLMVLILQRYLSKICIFYLEKIIDLWKLEGCLAGFFLAEFFLICTIISYFPISHSITQHPCLGSPLGSKIITFLLLFIKPSFQKLSFFPLKAVEEVQKRRGKVEGPILTEIPSQLNKLLGLLRILSCWHVICKSV